MKLKNFITNLSYFQLMFIFSIILNIIFSIVINKQLSYKDYDDCNNCSIYHNYILELEDVLHYYGIEPADVCGGDGASDYYMLDTKRNNRR